MQAPDLCALQVFPMLQGGPHEHQIAAIATQLKEVLTPEFCAYAKQIRLNAQALARALMAKGHRLATGLFCSVYIFYEGGAGERYCLHSHGSIWLLRLLHTYVQYCASL